MGKGPLTNKVSAVGKGRSNGQISGKEQVTSNGQTSKTADDRNLCIGISFPLYVKIHKHRNSSVALPELTALFHAGAKRNPGSLFIKYAFWWV
jgi:hypothetical protein